MPKVGNLELVVSISPGDMTLTFLADQTFDDGRSDFLVLMSSRSVKRTLCDRRLYSEGTLIEI